MNTGKIITLALALSIIGGMLAGCTNNQETEVPTEISTEIESAEIVESTEEEIVEDEVDTVQIVQDSDYPNLISGNLTKEEFEFVLSEGLEYFATDGIEETEYVMILNLLFAEGMNNEFIEVRDDRVVIDGFNMNAYSLTDVNRLISCFTDFQYSEDNDNDDTGNNVYVVGDDISIQEATKSNIVDSATITLAEYTAEEMIIYYTYESIFTDYDDGAQYQTIREKKAVLEPTDEGLYRIVSIINVGDEVLEDYEEVLNAYATIFYSSDSLGEGETVAALDVFSQYGCEINESGTMGDSGIFNPYSSSTTFKSETIDSIYAACIDINSDGISECIIALQDVGTSTNNKEYVDIWTLENGEPKWIISSEYRDIISLCEDGIIQEVVAGGADGSDYYYYQLQDTTLTLIDSGLYDGNVEMLEEKYPFVDYEFSWNEIKNPAE